MAFQLENKTETFKKVLDTFCKDSNDLEIVCSDGRKVMFKSYLLYFYSLNNFEVFTKSSTIFMEEDFETITLLRDLLTSGEGHAEGNPHQTIVKLVAAADSLNINLTENIDIKNYNMNLTDFISGIDEMALPCEMGLYFEFQNRGNGYPTGCPGFVDFDGSNNPSWSAINRSVLERIVEFD